MFPVVDCSCHGVICKTRDHHSSLLFCGFLLLQFGDTQTEILIRPQHIIAAVGSSATFTCESDKIYTAPHWITSRARKPHTELVYNGYLEESYRGKLDVIDEVNGTVRVTQLTIKNVKTEDAGVVFCRDDGEFGKMIPANLSVAYDIRCIATCGDDRLLLHCYTCYWSETTLYFLLKYHENIAPYAEGAPGAHAEDFNSTSHCVKLEAMWSIRTSCNSLNISSISIKVTENATEANERTSLGVRITWNLSSTTNSHGQSTNVELSTNIMQKNHHSCSSKIIMAVVITIALFLSAAAAVFRFSLFLATRNANRSILTRVSPSVLFKQPLLEKIDVKKADEKKISMMFQTGT